MGKWEERKRRLTNAGYDYYAIQIRVNEIIQILWLKRKLYDNEELKNNIDIFNYRN